MSGRFILASATMLGLLLGSGVASAASLVDVHAILRQAGSAADGIQMEERKFSALTEIARAGRVPRWVQNTRRSPARQAGNGEQALVARGALCYAPARWPAAQESGDGIACLLYSGTPRGTSPPRRWTLA